MDERLAYLKEYVEVLSSELVTTRKAARDLIAESEDRSTKQIAALSSRIDATDNRVASVRAAITGTNGTGLRRAATGLAITFVGVLLTLAGLPW